MFCFSWVVGIWRLDGIMKYIVIAISCVMFSMFVMSLASRVNISCNLTRWLGKYSYEIYVIQALPMHFFKSVYVNIQSEGLYISCTIVVTLALACLIKPCFQQIKKCMRFCGEYKR